MVARHVMPWELSRELRIIAEKQKELNCGDDFVYRPQAGRMCHYVHDDDSLGCLLGFWLHRNCHVPKAVLRQWNSESFSDLINPGHVSKWVTMGPLCVLLGERIQAAQDKRVGWLEAVESSKGMDLDDTD